MSKKTAKSNHTPGNVSKDDQTADAPTRDLKRAANAGAEAKNPSEPVKVEGAGDLNQDPREPYPVGAGQDPREEYRKIFGKYPDDEVK
jgi:hypothetical protein